MEHTEKRILMVEGEFPYPLNHGGRIDPWNKIVILHELGWTVDMVATVKEAPKREYIQKAEEYVEKVYLCERQNSVVRMLSKYPLQMTSRQSLQHVKFEHAYDVVFLEGEYVAPILWNRSLSYRHALLRMHNDEAIYFKNLSEAEPSLWKKLYYYLDSVRFRSSEPELIRKVDQLLFVSSDETKAYQRRYPEAKNIFLPVAVKLDCKARPRTGHTVSIIGSLFMTNNREGIEWYLSEVHPRLKSAVSDYRLLLAGNSRGEGVEWLRSATKGDPTVEIYDSPEDLEPIYAQTDVFANVMRHGAGVKLKTVNAIINGMPVVTTTIGNEGTGLIDGEHVFVRDEPQAFAEAVCSVLAQRERADRMIRAAQAYLVENYDQKKQLAALLETLE